MSTTKLHRPWHRGGRSHSRLRLGLTGLLAALIAATVLILSTASPTTESVSGSGISALQSRTLPAFTRLDLAGGNTVLVHVGGRQQVVVHADSNLLGRVTTEVRSGQLVIGTRPGQIITRTPMYVTVEVPELTGLRLDGAGEINVSGIRGARLAVAIPGHGTITASGMAGTLSVLVSGAGSADLSGLTARTATATLAGNGTITVTATERLHAVLSGTGTIAYGGNPAKVVRDLSGTGTITPTG